MTRTAPARARSATPSRDARQRAAVILEVLAGSRTPAQAAQALGLSLPRYYQLETVALQGLVRACEPVPKGRTRSVDTELAALRKQVQRLQRELARQQALVRLSQRTLGLPPPPAPAASKNAATGKGQGRKPRRATVRALRVARRLQEAAEAPLPASAATATREGLP